MGQNLYFSAGSTVTHLHKTIMRSVYTKVLTAQPSLTLTGKDRRAVGLFDALLACQRCLYGTEWGTSRGQYLVPFAEGDDGPVLSKLFAHIVDCRHLLLSSMALHNY
jgi:hypothetical protein